MNALMLRHQTTQMKKISTLTLILALIANSAAAQVVLDASDLPATSLNTGLYVVTDAGSSNYAPNGAGITWDFTSAQLQQMGSAVLGAATATPHAADYPQANWALTNDLFGLGQSYTYFHSSTDGLEIIADDVPDDPSVYIDPKKILDFPYAYQDFFSDAYQYEGESPVNVTWNYMAYGTVLTSIGTFTNVVKSVSSEGDVIFWNSAPLYPLIIISQGDPIIVMANSTAGISDRYGAGLMVFPNPATDEIILTGGVAGDRFTLTDALGRTVVQGTISDQERQSIAIAQLAAGNYHLRMQNANEAVVLPVIKR